MRRRLEKWVFQTRVALAGEMNRLADEAREPELDDAEAVN
jgi:hypothetical protein